MKLAGLAVGIALVLGAVPALAADVAVEMLNKGDKGTMVFQPDLVRIAVGDTITFTNADSMTHTATALDGSFDTGQLAKGKSAKVKISAAGAHPFHCAIHSSMKGTVTAK